VSDTTASIHYNFIDDFIDIIYNAAALLYNEDYMVILLRGNRWNCEAYGRLFSRLIINELPEKKGTYVLNVCDDPNNPFYCNPDSMSILVDMGMRDTDKFHQLADKWEMCMREKARNKYHEKVSNQYYQL
jgi:hypothetical protein